MDLQGFSLFKKYIYISLGLVLYEDIVSRWAYGIAWSQSKTGKQRTVTR